MAIEEKLKKLILERYGTLRTFVPYTGLSYSTVYTILRRGIQNSSVDNVIKICHALGISTDELAHNRIVPIQNEHEKLAYFSDVEKIIEYTKRNVIGFHALSLDGQPLSEDEIETLLDLLNTGVRIIKRNRK